MLMSVLNGWQRAKSLEDDQDEGHLHYCHQWDMSLTA